MGSSIPLFILHWNRPEECLRSVVSLRDQGLDLEVTVIDNCSEGAALSEISGKLPAQASLRQLKENLGWGGAFNILLNEWLASGNSEYCFICAHDALPERGCLQFLLQAAKADPHIGIASPAYENSELPVYSAIGGVKCIPVSARPAGTVEAVPYPHGTLMLLRRKCLAEVGVFDEAFFAYGDEFDLGMRCTKREWKVALVWDARVSNPGSWTPGKIKTYLFARNSLLLAVKHSGYAAALTRAVLMLANTLLLSAIPALRRGKYFGESFLTLRIKAISDFLRGSFGPPSIQ